MWSWKCTGCSEVFRGDTAEAAQKKFLMHAAKAHKKATIVSVNIEKEAVK